MDINQRFEVGQFQLSVLRTLVLISFSLGQFRLPVMGALAFFPFFLSLIPFMYAYLLEQPRLKMMALSRNI